MKDRPDRGHHRENKRTIAVKRDKMGRPLQDI
jgi:hypothetical protein